MRTWISFSVAAVALATGGAAVASDTAPDAPGAEVEAAADAPSPAHPGIEEVVATAKRPPPMEHASAGEVHVAVEAAFSAAPVEVAAPELQHAREDAPKLEAPAPAESE